MKLNLGCGLQVVDGYVNFDKIQPRGEDRVVVGNVLDGLPFHDDVFDEIYCSHFLHLFKYHEVTWILLELGRILQKDGVLHVVEFDPLLAVEALDNGSIGWFPIEDSTAESIDSKFCRMMSWHSTRQSLWTSNYMAQELGNCSFTTKSRRYGNHQLDQRPRESFYMEARLCPPRIGDWSLAQTTAD